MMDLLKEEAKDSGGKEEENPLIYLMDFMKGLLDLKDSHILYMRMQEGKGLETLSLVYRNLDPGEISGPILKSCYSAVLMSGTLSPPSMFGDVLGMKRDRRMEREYPSPFPSDNRLTVIDDGVTTAYNKRTREMYKRISDRISSIGLSCPGNIAVFFPSYSFMWKVKEHIKPTAKEIIAESKEMSRREKENILVDLKRSMRRGGAILLGVMGGSLSEGVDYKDNLLSCVVVVGLPLAPPSLEVISLREYARRKWGRIKGDDYSYNFPAMNRIIQAAGRPIRSERDRAVTILMETRLTEPRYLKFLPRDLKPKRISGQELASEVSSFFS
jgi:DNA excision repair protein ERCC-2